VTIRRPPNEVFAFLVDPANIPKWNYAIDSARQVSAGPLGVGTRIQQTRSVPRPTTEELVITELVPERRMVLEGLRTVGDANDDESGQWSRVRDSRPSSRARRTAARRLLTPSLA
jgi:uncharacterized protein YndB with AHSA1/START domain